MLMKKLKIVLFSDIHTDIGNALYKSTYLAEVAQYINQIKNIDLLICAGDISPSILELANTLEFLSENIASSYYLMVPGNHDIWYTEEKLTTGISKAKYEYTIKEAVEQTKFHYLPNNPLIIDNNFAVIGNIAWYDYSFRNKKWDSYLKSENSWYDKKVYNYSRYNDVIYADWAMKDEEVVIYLLNQLKNDYKKVQSIPYKIAVFHHIPFREGVLYKNNLEWDYFSSFMGSNSFGAQLLDLKIPLILHVHTHFPLKYQINSCKVFCAPIGYPTEWQSNNIIKELSERIKIIDFP